MSDVCEVLVYGGINIDLVTRSDRFPAPGQTILGDQFVTYAGGKGANQAVAVSQLGLVVCMLGAVGDDVFAPTLLEGLKTKGVIIDDIATVPNEHSGVAVINVDKSSQNQIIQVHGANAYSEKDLIVKSMEDKASIRYLMLQLESPLDISEELAVSAKHRDVTVMLDPGPTRPIPPRLFECVSIITPNETEAEYITGIPVMDVESGFAAARKIKGMGIPKVVVKMGSQGALYIDDCDEVYVPAVKIDAVDSVAAGDAFNGGLIYGIYHGWSIEETMKWAVCSGGLATTRIGAQDAMPSLETVKACYQKTFL
tara:strand:+ start:11102 stop:12034 length:933 start_codon:yes stop_codon:yes gene_type:complete